MNGRTLRYFSFVALAALSGAAGAQTHCGTHFRIDDPIPGLIAPSTTQVRLSTMMTGLVSPVGGAVAPGIGNRVFVLDQTGKIWSLYVSGPRGCSFGMTVLASLILA